MPTISGVTKDSSGNPCSAMVRAYKRDTGAFVGQAVSDAVSGAYSISTPYSSEHYVIRMNGTPDSGDPFWDQVMLDISMEGSFSDSKGHTVTAYSGAAITSTDPLLGSSCGLFDAGLGAFLNISSLTELAGYAGDITIEVEFQLASQPSGESWNSSFYILGGGGSNADGGLDFAIGNSTIWFSQAAFSSRTLSGAWTYDTNKHHLAVVRVENDWTMYLDGAVIATATSSSAFYSGIVDVAVSKVEQLGGATGGSFNGKMQCLRITMSAKYTEPFIPPTSMLKTSAAPGTPTEDAQVHDNITAI